MIDKYRKIFIIFLCNVLAICSIIILFEISFRVYLTGRWSPKRIFLHSISVDDYISRLLNKEYIPLTSTNHFRADLTGKKAKPVLFMGCSFTWGDGLKHNETVSYKYAKITNHTVYNRAGKGWGLDHMLYLLQRKDFYQSIDEPEYLIYIFITRHLYRIDKFKMMPNCRDFQPKYKILDGKLVEEKPHFWHASWIIEKYMWDYRDKYNPYNNTNQMFDIMKLYFLQSKSAMKKHWPNTKFVILKYPINAYDGLYETKRWEELTDAGFIVLDATELSKKQLWENKYKCDGWHPNSQVWDLLVPKLAQKLQKY